MIKRRDVIIAFYIVLCVMVNLVGRIASDSFGLPFWLDSVGTIAAAYALGPICGAVVGLTLNLMYGAIQKSAYAYCITNVMVGVTAGVLCRKGMLKNRFNAFSLSMILAVVSAVVSVPVNLIFFNGMNGNVWGNSVVNYMLERNINRYFSSFSGEFYVDLVDKIISVFIIYIISRRLFNREYFRKLSKFIWSSIFVVLFSSLSISLITNDICAAENEGEDYSSYIQTIYNDDDGVVGSEVNDIAQTRDGVLWFGTYGGLYKYDGNRFVFMSQFESVRNVNCLYTDEESRLWIGTNDSGLSICANDEIVNVIDETGGLSANSVRSIVKNSNGYYFVGTTGALNVLSLVDGLHVEAVFNELTYVKCLSSNDNQYTCVVDSNGRMGVFFGKELVTIIDTDENGEKFTGVYFDNNGNLYTATADNKVHKCAIEDNRLKVFESYTCTGLDGINSLYKNNIGDVFVCSDSGIGYITSDNKFNIIKTNGFDSSIDNMLVDYQGNYWFSSSRLGLLKLCKSNFDEIFFKNGMGEKIVNCVTKWNGMYVFGTDSGIDMCDINLQSSVDSDLKDIFNNVRIRCLAVDDSENLWVATSGKGVYKVRTTGFYEQFDASMGLAGNKARAFCMMSDGEIAIATDNGISILNKGKFITYKAEDGLVTEKTLCILEYEDSLLCGTDGGGIAVIRNNKIERLIRRADGLGSDIVLRMVKASDNSGVIIITSNSICFLDNNGNVRKINSFQYYNNYDIIHSEDGKLWITCSAGIYIVDEKLLIADELSDFELIDSKKGLRESLVANSWNYLDESGKLILCGDTGAVSVNMAKYDLNSSSYRIMLDSIKIDDISLSVEKEEVNKINRNAVRIEFFPRVVNYSLNDPFVSVWLEGFDKEPRVMLQSQLDPFVYTNLPAGDYVFHIAILNSKQESKLEEVTYLFSKEKELYDNWWFNIYLFLIVAIILVYLVWLIVGTQINKSLQIQRKELENLKLKQAADAAVAAGEAKDRFLALMSHDIRTPINAILGMDEMILRECSEPAVYEYATDIKSAGGTLLSIVNSILDFSKIEQGKMEIIPVEYEIKSLIKNIVTGIKLRAENKSLEFMLDVDSNLPSKLLGDDVRISQVLSNVLTNAVKYTEKGWVKLTVREEQKNQDKIFIYFEVKDSGIGIRKEDMEKLFESFQRLDEKRNRNIEGTGLGMSIVTNLLALMNSKLSVESEYGVGSTFSFILEQKIISDEPMGDIKKEIRNTRNIDSKATEVHLKAPKASILVVDDSEMNLKVARALLKVNMIVPDTATSGSMAIDMAKEKHYDIIFLDHMMPEMDGIETLAVLKSEHIIGDDTKVIILTANAIEGAKEQYLKQGFDDYISKPVDARILENKIETFLPKNLLEDTFEVEINPYENDDEAIRLHKYCPNLDVSVGMKYCMDSWDFYRDIMNAILDEYTRGDKLKTLCEHYESGNYPKYQVIIHALKSTTLSVGEVELNKAAKKLEQAAKDGDYDYIKDNHNDFVERFLELTDGIDKYLKEVNGDNE